MTDDELIARKVNADTALMGILNENLYKDTAMAYDELMEKAKRIAASDPTSFGRLEYQAIIRMLLSAEAENAALLALLEEIKGRVQFGTSTHMSSDIVKMCDAALKEGK